MFLDFAACRDLDPALFKLLAAFAHHAEGAGECRVLQAKLAAEMAISASTVCRWTADLVQRGCLTRARIGGGSYRYTIALWCLAELLPPATFNSFTMKEFVPAVQINCSTIEQSNFPTAGKSKSHPKTAGNPKGAEAAPPELHPVKSGIAHAASPDSGAPADAPALVVPSSGSKEPSERELSLSQDEIPNGWEEAAAAERRLAGLAPVNLPCEWRKLVAYSEGQKVSIWRWRGWVLKARGDHSAGAEKGAVGTFPAAEFCIQNRSAPNRIPGDERQQRQARDWVRSGFWLRSGTWGPAPDQPGCTLPPALVAWCLRERAALAAA